MKKIKITCFGGGHGLGRLLRSLAHNEQYELSAIVNTADNGGSTGKLKRHDDTIGWGDIRHCMCELANKDSLEYLLFSHRFTNDGELNNHALGNLMLFACDQLCLRPTETVKVINQMLKLSAKILPMSDTSCEIVARNNQGQLISGEKSIDHSLSQLDLNSLSFNKIVVPTKEVIDAINHSDLLIIAPGSYVTSILPPLLMQEVIEAINNSESPLIMVANLEDEISVPLASIQAKLNYLNKLGLKNIDHIFWPEHRPFSGTEIKSLKKYTLPSDHNKQHCEKSLFISIQKYIQNEILSLAI